MPNISEFIDAVNGAIKDLPFDLAILLLAASYGAVFVVALVFCAATRRVRAADKRPFLHFTNLYTALIFAVITASSGAERAVVPCALFWAAGYLLYGALCLFGQSEKNGRESAAEYAVSMPNPAPQKREFRPEAPAAKTNVRLEHAINITDRLLNRETGRSDRIELEKIKSTLTFLSGKAALTVQESDILNDNFNALLKLMARYGE